MRIRSTAGLSVMVLLGAASWVLRAADDGRTLTWEQKEEFLKSAHIDQVKTAKKGVTDTVVVTLSDGTVTHDASVQRIDEYKATFQGSSGSTETNFKDSYKFNIAGWRLAKLLGIEDMIPPSVERKYEGTTASFTWWVEDIQMDEQERLKRKTQPPDLTKWNEEVYVVRVFDQLIYNVDRNMTNMLIDKNWRLWMIDHSRSFRMQHSLQAPKNLVQCDRNLLAKMKTLDQPTLEKELRPYVTKEEIKGLLARRDLIVKTFDAKGAGALYDRPPRS